MHVDLVGRVLRGNPGAHALALPDRVVFTPSTGAPVWRRMIVNASASVPAAAGVTAVVVGDSAPS